MTTNDQPGIGKAIGARIIESRTKQGIKQAALARTINVTPTTLWRYECGVVVAGAEVLARIADALGVSLDWLIKGEGEQSLPRSCPQPAA